MEDGDPEFEEDPKEVEINEVHEDMDDVTAEAQTLRLICRSQQQHQATYWGSIYCKLPADVLKPKIKHMMNYLFTPCLRLHFGKSEEVVNPVGYQWDFWKDGNTNRGRKVTEEEEMEMKIYRELENHPRIDQAELHTYGVSVGLLDQDGRIVRQLHDVVVIYNRMAPTRRRFLFKKLHGATGKEMSLMMKKIEVDTALAESLVDDILTARGHCPPVPAVFKALPKLK